MGSAGCVYKPKPSNKKSKSKNKNRVKLSFRWYNKERSS